MKRLLSIVVLLPVVFAPCTYADSIPTLIVTQAQINVFFQVAPDNAVYTFTGPGLSLTGGATGCTVQQWCTPFGFEAGLFPGSSLYPIVDPLFLDSVQGSVTIGGQGIGVNPTNSFLSISSIIPLGTFQFPTNGQSTFTVTMPAVLGPVSLTTQLPNTPFNQEFQLQLPPGSWTLNFGLVPAQNSLPAFYQFWGGTFVGTTVPEPGTLGMMATGLAGVIGAIRRKRLICR